MKTCIVFLALLAVAVAQHDHFGALIHNEVNTLLTADPALTIDQCTTSCDALFDLVDVNDEQHTDDMCKHACDCEINKTCGHHTHGPTTAMPAATNPSHHHTHPPHPDHPAHPDHP